MTQSLKAQYFAARAQVRLNPHVIRIVGNAIVTKKQAHLVNLPWQHSVAMFLREARRSRSMGQLDSAHHYTRTARALRRAWQ